MRSHLWTFITLRSYLNNKMNLFGVPICEPTTHLAHIETFILFLRFPFLNLHYTTHISKQLNLSIWSSHLWIHNTLSTYSNIYIFIWVPIRESLSHYDISIQLNVFVWSSHFWIHNTLSTYWNLYIYIWIPIRGPPLH